MTRPRLGTDESEGTLLQISNGMPRNGQAGYQSGWLTGWWWTIPSKV